jgi:ribonucleoside-diphosphate reductase alpha chain
MKHLTTFAKNNIVPLNQNIQVGNLIMTTQIEGLGRTIKRTRKQKLSGDTYSIKTGCGMMYVTINEDENGLFEVFATLGKSGGCASSQIEALGRTISLGLRSGIPAEQFIKQLRGISCHSALIVGENKISSCADAIATAIQMKIKEGNIK